MANFRAKSAPWAAFIFFVRQETRYMCALIMCIDYIFVAATDTCVTRCIYRVHTFSTVSRRQIHHFESTIHFFWRLRPAFYTSLILWIHLGFRIIKVIFVKLFQLIECSPTQNRLVPQKKFNFARDARTRRVKIQKWSDWPKNFRGGVIEGADHEYDHGVKGDGEVKGQNF